MSIIFERNAPIAQEMLKHMRGICTTDSRSFYCYKYMYNELFRLFRVSNPSISWELEDEFWLTYVNNQSSYNYTSQRSAERHS